MNYKHPIKHWQSLINTNFVSKKENLYTFGIVRIVNTFTWEMMNHHRDNKHQIKLRFIASSELHI